jgi:two-component system, chemotaxis family, protein-glutamate methylesterase/glutaminase
MPLRVLVVDDSLTMRTLLTDILISDPQIAVVDVAKSGSEALTKLSKFKPHCVTLDLVMPGENGLTTLKAIMNKRPTPVVILSALAKKDASITFECLAAGAVAFVPKPSGELSLDIETIKTEILETVKAVSNVTPEKLKPIMPRRDHHLKRLQGGLGKIVVIGASTGGPQTVEKILTELPEDIPFPILVVQHMPNPFFTANFAERLNRNCPLEVKVAQDQDTLEMGTVYLALPGFYLTFHRESQSEPVVMRMTEDKFVSGPSVDQVMQAVARVYGADTVGVILSGMGKDGTEGMEAIKACQGTTIAQDENALIFGMPRSAIEAGVVDRVLSEAEIVKALTDLTWMKEARYGQN